MDCASRFSTHLGTTTTTICLFINVSCVLACCGKHNQNASNQTIVPKLSPYTPKKIIKKIYKAISSYMCMKTKQQQLSPYASKKIIKKISKAIPYVCVEIKQEEDDRCLWRKTILMGEKCQPLQFSGAIFYDSKGNRLSEPPRSPRTSPFLLSAVAKRGEIEM